MKRFAAFALVGSFPLLAVAGPVSVYPPPAPPAAPPTSLNQPLSAAVQSAATTLPPAPVMSSTPSWGTPTVLPGTTVLTPGGVPCGDPAPVRPYFNPLAARAGCDTVRGTCLDKFKEWLCFRSSPGGFPCQPVPYRAPLRAYFPVPAHCGTGGACASGNCAGGAAPRVGAGVATGRGDWCTVAMPVTPLKGDWCDTPTVRPRVQYLPLSGRAEGCDARPARTRLLDRLFGGFGPKCDTTTCGPDGCLSMPVAETPLTPDPAVTAPVPMTPPVPMTTTPMGTGTTPMNTKPVFTPQGKPAGTTIQLSPQKPFTNP